MCPPFVDFRGRQAASLLVIFLFSYPKKLSCVYCSISWKTKEFPTPDARQPFFFSCKVYKQVKCANYWERKVSFWEFLHTLKKLFDFSFTVHRQHSSWTGGQPGPVGEDHWLPDSAPFLCARLPLLFPQTPCHPRRGAGNWVRVTLRKPSDPFHVRHCFCNHASGRKEFFPPRPQFFGTT